MGPVHTLCIALLLVALRLPNSLPWKADVKESTDNWGVPGDWFHMVESEVDQYHLLIPFVYSTWTS